MAKTFKGKMFNILKSGFINGFNYTQASVWIKSKLPSVQVMVLIHKWDTGGVQNVDGIKEIARGSPEVIQPAAAQQQQDSPALNP